MLFFFLVFVVFVLACIGGVALVDELLERGHRVTCEAAGYDGYLLYESNRYCFLVDDGGSMTLKDDIMQASPRGQ